MILYILDVISFEADFPVDIFYFNRTRDVFREAFCNAVTKEANEMDVDINKCCVSLTTPGPTLSPTLCMLNWNNIILILYNIQYICIWNQIYIILK